MRSFPCPYVWWFPGSSPEVVSSDVYPRAKTVTLIYELLTGRDPVEIAKLHNVNAEEFCVAVLFELTQRRRQVPKGLEVYISDLKRWAEAGLDCIRKREPVSWPPRFVKVAE